MRIMPTLVVRVCVWTLGAVSAYVVAGLLLTVGRMTPHRPFNDTEKAAVVQSDHDTKSIPTEFAYYLSQIYPLMDEGRGDVSMLLQLAAFGNGMDTWIANGPPVAMQKAMRIVLGPTARLLGYRPHYEKYRPRRP